MTLDRFPHDDTLDGLGDDWLGERPRPRPEQDPDDAMEAREEARRLEREHEERRERAALHRRLIACDRAAYEAMHGTLDGPPETHRWDADPR